MKHKVKKLGIVDDAPFIREVLRNIASSQGWHVVGEAENGIEAAHMAMVCRPQVVLMDMVMPNANGLEAAKKIISDNPSIKVIACSTMDQENILLKAVEIGCCSFITKPFQKDDVVKVVNQAFELIEEDL
jgi:two-component system chemotaxis response regulator CheY